MMNRKYERHFITVKRQSCNNGDNYLRETLNHKILLEMLLTLAVDSIVNTASKNKEVVIQNKCCHSYCCDTFLSHCVQINVLTNS